jgi:EAL domain-containing protein (putative c-di-GMP-specific phosphodiesterase class I)
MASNGDVLAVIHATLTLVENLGMSSIAEGIEDAAQLAILQSLGCRYAQGRWLGEPVPGDRLLESWGKPHNVVQYRSADTG